MPVQPMRSHRHTHSTPGVAFPISPLSLEPRCQNRCNRRWGNGSLAVISARKFVRITPEHHSLRSLIFFPPPELARRLTRLRSFPSKLTLNSPSVSPELH